MVDVAVGSGMASAYPDIETFTRLGRLGENFVQYGTHQFKESEYGLCRFQFLPGLHAALSGRDTHTALTQPNSIVITKAFADKYFGAEPALGKSIDLDHYGVCKVTGVIDKVPDNAHFHFDAFVSWSTLHIRQYTWSNVGYYTYLVLRPGADPKKITSALSELVAKYAVPEIARDMGVPLAQAQKAVNTFVFSLTPLTDIHLHSDTKYELEANGKQPLRLIFTALALFILLLACANFTNLSTASAPAAARKSASAK